MPKIKSDDALELAKIFKESALTLGQYQLDNWEDLTKSERRDLTDEEYTLLDYSQSLVTHAVGVMLDDAGASLDAIKAATADANAALKNIAEVKQGLGIAVALITLGAAIYAGNLGGIVSALGKLKEAADSK